MEKIKRPPKTVKEKAFVREYIRTLNATEAASRVYGVTSRKSATSLGNETLSKLDISAQLDKIGLTDRYIYSGIKEGTKAQRTVSAQILVKSDGTTIRKEDEGIIEVPDHTTRHKYWVTALELKGKLKREGAIDNNIQNTVMNVISYGNNDPLQLRSEELESASIAGDARPAPLPSPQLAPEGEKDNASDQPVDKVGEPS